jgi:hypothetical protein
MSSTWGKLGAQWCSHRRREPEPDRDLHRNLSCAAQGGCRQAPPIGRIIRQQAHAILPALRVAPLAWLH